MFIYFTFFESFIKFVTKLVNIYTGWNNLSVCGNDVVRRQFFCEDRSCKGIGVKKMRSWNGHGLKKMVPVKDSVWRNCSCKGHGLQRLFLWRMWSVKTFPVKDRMFELVISNACKGPGLGRYFLQRRSGFFTPICKQCVFVLAALPLKVNAPARPFD